VFYSASFVCSQRSVSFTHLYSLSAVTYRLRDLAIEHSAYTAALGVSDLAHFPAFADDSVTGYGAWLHDLQSIMEPFFSGSDSEFIQAAASYMAEQAVQHQRDTQQLRYHSAQEPRLKAHARSLFQQGRYAEVVQLEREIRFPEFLSRSERQLFTLARQRA